MGPASIGPVGGDDSSGHPDGAFDPSAELIDGSDNFDDGIEQLDADFVLDTGFDPDEFAPPPPPWYRTPGAIAGIGALGVGVVALTVSAAVLVARPVVSSEETVGPAAEETTDAPVVQDASSTDVSTATRARTTPPTTTQSVATTPNSASQLPPPEATQESVAPVDEDAIEDAQEEAEEAAEDAAESSEEAAEEAEEAAEDAATNGPTRTNVTRTPQTRTQISVLPPG